VSHAEPASGFEVPSRGAHMFRAVKHREFRVMWGTFIVGQFGFWVSFIAMQALMARLTDTSGSWLGLLFFVNFFPMLVFTPVAGVVADRVDRRNILRISYSALTALMSALALLTLSGAMTPAGLLPFAFGIGTVFSFNAPASQAVVANAVPRIDLASAISLQSGGANLARVVGPTVAAPILAVWDEGAAFIIYAVTSAIVVFLLGRIHLSGYIPESDDGRFFARLRRGFDHARERPPALASLSVMAMSSLFAGSYLAMLPVLASDVFDKGPSGFATLAAVAGFGSMIGALTTALRWSTPTLRSAALLVAAFGASVAGFAASPTWTIALALSVVTGVFYFSGMTTFNTLVQHLTDESMRGRMSSLFLICWAGLVPIGGLWQGIVAARIGVRPTMMLAGAVTALYALLVVIVEYRRGVAVAPAHGGGTA
jgi:MFS family permease